MKIKMFVRTLFLDMPPRLFFGLFNVICNSSITCGTKVLRSGPFGMPNRFGTNPQLGHANGLICNSRAEEPSQAKPTDISRQACWHDQKDYLKFIFTFAITKILD